MKYSSQKLNSILSKAEALKVCKVFKTFLIEVLIGLKEYLPYEDIIFKHIKCLDPLFSKLEDWMLLAKRFPNIINEKEFPEFYDDISN